MPGTKITFHQIYIKPGETIFVDHLENGTVGNFETDIALGGNPDQSHIIRLLVVEPASDEELQEARDLGSRIISGAADWREMLG